MFLVAWYTAQATATANGTSADGLPVTATTDVPSLGEIGFDLKASVEIVRSLGGGSSAPTSMQLTTYNASFSGDLEDAEDDDNFYFGYYTNSVLHWKAGQIVANKDYWRLYKVNVKLDVDNSGKVKSGGTATSYTEAEAISFLSANSSAAAKLNGFSLAIARKDGETNNRAVFKVEQSTATTASSAYDKTSLTATDLSATACKVVASTGTDFYFGMYVEGTGTDNAAVTGGFTATVTAVHVNYEA